MTRPWPTKRVTSPLPPSSPTLGLLTTTPLAGTIVCPISTPPLALHSWRIWTIASKLNANSPCATPRCLLALRAWSWWRNLLVAVAITGWSVCALRPMIPRLPKPTGCSYWRVPMSQGFSSVRFGRPCTSCRCIAPLPWALCWWPRTKHRAYSTCQVAHSCWRAG